MPLKLITGPTAEPISLAEAKAHLQEVVTDNDALITSLIAAVRQFAENKTQRQMIAARWKLVLDSFPGPDQLGVPWGKPFGLPPNAILIPLAPVLQVVSITYLDMASVRQTLDATTYFVDYSTEPCRITPIFGQIWPANTLPQIGAVEITFDAGYAAPLTADSVGDTISVPGWKTLVVGDTLRVSNRDKTALGDGALPAPLGKLTDYYVQTVSGTNLYKLSASSGGAAIDLTTNGTGESFIGEIPEGLKAWMLLSMRTVYDNRAAAMIGPRAAAAQLPLEFVDAMLDPFSLVLY